jgi:L-2-hydroxyglutarate oxidase
MECADVLVVGGGIVGLATARALRHAHPSAQVVVVEKEHAVGMHQSGRNSGVIHAGVYYQPGSEKARLCAAGRKSIVAYCQDHGIAHEVCGKVVVARDAVERERLSELEHRCAANGVRARIIGRDELREIEPHVAGVAALHVLDTGVVDYADVCRSFAHDLQADGVTLRTNCEVTGASERDSGVVVETTRGAFEAQRVVTCAGLHADVVAEAISGPEGANGLRVIAFRGEYRALAPARAYLVRHLVYPVPDPRYPFLGVHLTRAIDGEVHAGPNAVLAFAREGYEWRRLNMRELGRTLRFPGFRRFAAQNWRFGLHEMRRSLSQRRFTAAVRDLIPEIERTDLERAPSGVRAQAIRPNGELVDDFAFHQVGRALHVLNAPSPAATASLEIGAAIAARLEIERA